MSNEQDRAVGALVGLAVGDALGAPLWGIERDSQPRLTDMQTGGVLDGAAGDWSYATSTALLVGRTIADMHEFNSMAIMHAFLGWYDTGHYVPGKHMVEYASVAVKESLDVFKSSRRIVPNLTCTDAASLVRVAPIAIAFKSSASCILAAKKQNDLTHGNSICAELCTFTAEAMRASIYQRGIGKEGTLAFYDTLSIKLGRWRERDRDYISSSSFVVHVIKAALWAIDLTNTFEDALILAVNLGGESTMIGAVTGQLAGVIYGVEAIPKRWIEQLAWKDYIFDTANDLYKCALNDTTPGVKNA